MCQERVKTTDGILLVVPSRLWQGRVEKHQEIVKTIKKLQGWLPCPGVPDQRMSKLSPPVVNLTSLPLVLIIALFLLGCRGNFLY